PNRRDPRTHHLRIARTQEKHWRQPREHQKMDERAPACSVNVWAVYVREASRSEDVVEGAMGLNVARFGNAYESLHLLSNVHQIIVDLVLRGNPPSKVPSIGEARMAADPNALPLAKLDRLQRQIPGAGMLPA